MITFPPSPHRYVGMVHVGVVYLVAGVDGFIIAVDVIVSLKDKDGFGAGF